MSTFAKPIQKWEWNWAIRRIKQGHECTCEKHLISTCPESVFGHRTSLSQLHEKPLQCGSRRQWKDCTPQEELAADRPLLGSEVAGLVWDLAALLRALDLPEARKLQLLARCLPSQWWQLCLKLQPPQSKPLWKRKQPLGTIGSLAGFWEAVARSHSSQWMPDQGKGEGCPCLKKRRFSS